MIVYMFLKNYSKIYNYKIFQIFLLKENMQLEDYSEFV